MRYAIQAGKAILSNNLDDSIAKVLIDLRLVRETTLEPNLNPKKLIVATIDSR